MIFELIILLIFFCFSFAFLVLCIDTIVVADSKTVYILEAKLGHQGKAAGEFSIPHSIAFDSLGNMYVTDNSNDRVQKFTSIGTFITKWGSHGTADGQIGLLLGIDVDSSGNVYTVDQANSRIQKFDSSGRFITGWTNPEFSKLEDIELDSSGNVYVTDREKNEIFKFVQVR